MSEYQHTVFSSRPGSQKKEKKMASESTKKDNKQVDAKRPVALLFELENSVVNGRALFFDVCKRLLAERDIALTPALFLRYCQNVSIEKSMIGLLDAVGKKRLSPEKLASEIADEMKVAMADKQLKMSSAFTKLLAKSKEENAVFGALTALPQDVAVALVKRLDLSGTLTKIHHTSPDVESFPTADAWLKLAKSVGVVPQGCIVLTTTTGSSRAALSGGMRPVACPDEFTDGQDFGGADLYVEKLNDEAIASIVSLMRESR